MLQKLAHYIVKRFKLTDLQCSDLSVSTVCGQDVHKRRRQTARSQRPKALTATVCKKFVHNDLKQFGLNDPRGSTSVPTLCFKNKSRTKTPNSSDPRCSAPISRRCTVKKPSKSDAEQAKAERSQNCVHLGSRRCVFQELSKHGVKQLESGAALSQHQSVL